MNDDTHCVNGSVIENFMVSNGYTQLVKHPTTDQASVLDHVYFSNHCNDIHVQVRDVYYSDHDAIFCSIPLYML